MQPATSTEETADAERSWAGAQNHDLGLASVQLQIVPQEPYANSGRTPTETFESLLYNIFSVSCSSVPLILMAL